MLGELTTIDIPERPLVIIPLGATEQHGPHLPLDTDTRIAAAWAQMVSDRLEAEGYSVLVAPTLPYGASGEHQGFQGTMSVGNEALTEIVIQLGRSMRDWAGGLIFLSGHAGNYRALHEAEQKLGAEGDAVLAMVPRLAGSDAHAGHTETSMMLFLHPDLVRTEDAASGCTDAIAEIMPALMSDGVKGVSPNGVLGDPTRACATEGEELLGRLVAQALTAINEVFPRS